MVKVSENVLGKMAEAFGIKRETLAYLGGGKEFSDGTVYSFLRDGKAYALKVLGSPVKERTTTLRAIEERIRFIHFAGCRGVDVVYPLLNLNDRLTELIEEDEHIFVGYQMELVSGEINAKTVVSPGFAKRFGRVIGKLHRVARDYPLWKGSGADGDCEVLGWQYEVDFFTGWCRDEEIKARWIEMKEELTRLPRDRSSFGFIHNDMHVGNVIYTADHLKVIDFDVANFHWFITDVVAACQSFMNASCGGFDRPFRNRDAFRRYANDLLEGYALENRIDSCWIERMPLFMNYRRMVLYTAMQDFFSSHPQAQETYRQMIRVNPALSF